MDDDLSGGEASGAEAAGLFIGPKHSTGKSAPRRRGAKCWGPPIANDVSEADLPGVLRTIAHQNFGFARSDDPGYGYCWKDKKFTGDGNRWRATLYCAYHNESKCQWRLELVHTRKGEGEPWLATIRASTCAHADHTKSKRKRGVPMAIRELLSPTKFELPLQQVKD